MTDYSKLLVEKLLSMGFYNFLLFIVTLTAIYAILKNKKLLGNSPIINGLISFSIAFFVFAYPAITGVSIAQSLSAFITQAMILCMVLLLGVLIASIFYPNIIEFLQKAFTSRNLLFGAIALSVALFVTSGLVTVIFVSPSPTQGPFGPTGTATQTTNEISLIIGGLILTFIILLIASHISKGA